MAGVLRQKQDIQAEAEQRPGGSTVLTDLSKKSKPSGRSCGLGRALGKDMRKSQRSRQCPKRGGLYAPWDVTGIFSIRWVGHGRWAEQGQDVIFSGPQRNALASSWVWIAEG